MISTIDTSKRVFCVRYRDNENRRCCCWINATDMKEAKYISTKIDRVEDIFEIDPQTGCRL